MNLGIQGYLLDENLSPKLKAGFGADVRVIHARELGDNPSDFMLWTYAKSEALVIVTKDADFLDYVLVQDTTPPWVVQLKCGNLRARELREFLEAQWPAVTRLLAEYRLLRVHTDRIEGIS